MPNLAPTLPKSPALGLALAGVTAGLAYALAQVPLLQAGHLSPLVIAIVLGMLGGNLLPPERLRPMQAGLAICQRPILRLAVVLFGLRIGFPQVLAVGWPGLVADLLMLGSTFALGIWLGRKVFGLDRDTAILCAAGSSICGAAAVLATEAVLKPAAHKVTIAVGTVVLFGTLAMALYPVLFPHTGMSPATFGIYAGSTVHEVAQVVAVGSAVGPEAAETAVIVKLTRVLMLAPFLLLLSLHLQKGAPAAARLPWTRLIPWFAVAFVALVGVNSLGILPPALVEGLKVLGSFLMTLAMAALGWDSRYERLRAVGPGPLLCTLVLFFWLVGGGFVVNWGLSQL